MLFRVCAQAVSLTKSGLATDGAVALWPACPTAPNVISERIQEKKLTLRSSMVFEAKKRSNSFQQRCTPSRRRALQRNEVYGQRYTTSPPF